MPWASSSTNRERAVFFLQLLGAIEDAGGQAIRLGTNDRGHLIVGGAWRPCGDGYHLRVAQGSARINAQIEATGQGVQRVPVRGAPGVHAPSSGQDP